MPTGIYKHPPQCGFQKRHSKYKNAYSFPTGKNNPFWKNGKFINKDGYIMIYKPNHPFCMSNNYIREHRLIIEKQIRRYLLFKEKVHHLGKRNDNRLKMLMAFINQSAHIRFEKNPNNVKPKEIIFDGRLL